MDNVFGIGTVIFILWLIFRKRWQSRLDSKNRAYSAGKRLDEPPLFSGFKTGRSKFVQVRDGGNNIVSAAYRTTSKW